MSRSGSFPSWYIGREIRQKGLTAPERHGSNDEYRRDGDRALLLVRVKDQGFWNLGLRNSSATNRAPDAPANSLSYLALLAWSGKWGDGSPSGAVTDQPVESALPCLPGRNAAKACALGRLVCDNRTLSRACGHNAALLRTGKKGAGMTSTDKVAHAQFTASIPANYDRYLGPVIFDPYARDLAQRIRRSVPGHILETACGSGIATRRLLETLQPDADFVAP